MQRQISDGQILGASLESLRNAIYVSMPGSVVTYDSTNQVADVQPMTNDPRQNVDTGEMVSEPWPILKAVPICWPRFGGYVVAGPLQQNDPVILMAWDLDPSTWLAQGKSGKPVDPADVRRLGGNYWRAIPANIFGPMTDAAAAGAGLVIGKDGDPAQIRIQAGSLQLGNAGGDFLALASKVNSAINALASAISGWTPVPNDGGAALKAALASWLGTWASGSVASTLVKAQ